MSNATALRTVLEHVQEHQGDWRQDEWSNCFAGQTLRVLAGATTVTSCCPGCGGLDVEGETLYGSNIGVRAAQLLELEPSQAFRLFHAGNTLEQLGRMVEEFATADAPTLDVDLVA